MGRFQENVGARLQQRETFKADVERSVPQIQKEAAKLEENYKLAEKNLDQARQDLAKVQSEIMQQSGAVFFMEQSLSLGEAKLARQTRVIEDEFSAEKGRLSLDLNNKLSEVSEKYKPEIAEAERLLIEYRSKIEAGQSLDENARKALSVLGLDVTYQAGLVLEGAHKGEELQQKRLENFGERMERDKVAVQQDNKKALEAAEADMVNSLSDAKSSIEKKTAGFGEKIKQGNVRLGELESVRLTAEEKVHQLEERKSEIGRQRDVRMNDSKEVVKVVGELQALIEKDRDMLDRAAEKMSSVELRGAEALKSLNEVADVIALSEFSVVVETAKSMDSLEEATKQWAEEINDEANKKIDGVSERKRVSVDTVTARVLENNEDLELDAEGNFKAKNGATGFEAVDMIEEAYQPVKPEIRAIRDRARNETREVNLDRDRKLDELNRARVSGETRMNQMMEETRSNLAVMSSLVGFLRDEATERFGGVTATENPTEDNGLTAFMKRAGKAVSGMWSRLIGRGR